MLAWMFTVMLVYDVQLFNIERNGVRVVRDRERERERERRKEGVGFGW